MKRKHVIGAVSGIAFGGLIATWIGKTVMEAGIFVLSIFTTIATGFLIGKLTSGKRRATR